MADSIFLLDGDSTLRELTEAHYLTEAHLQQLLADHPQLLAGKQLDELHPRRWLLVQRELGIPDSEESGNRWSIDHLFLDQDGIPTLVEVKRSTDTRIRREVIGQLLDYAANATVYWTAETLLTSYEKTCASRNVDPHDTLEAFLGADAGATDNPESNDFWERVQTNLRAGKIRMLIVADTIPSELQRIIEFLNEQMDPAEILGIAIKQYKADGLRTLVPRVVGLTTVGEGKKSGRSGRAGPQKQWSLEKYYAEVEKDSPKLLAVARHIIEHYSAKSDTQLTFGTGKRPSVSVHAQLPQRVSLFVLGMDKFQFVQNYFYLHRGHAPLSDDVVYNKWRSKLNAIEGVEPYLNHTEKAPWFPMKLLLESRALTRFLEAYDWLTKKIADNS